MSRNLMFWMRITNSGADDEQVPVQQMEYLGKVGDGGMVSPYGLHGNVPEDTLVLGVPVQGSPGNRAAIGVLPKNRPQLAAGEVVFYHPLLPDLLIKLQASGEMLIKSTVKINIVAPETEFTGIVKANGKVIDDTHGHVQGADSGGDTEAAISGVT